MREIKFRGIDLNGKWVFGDLQGNYIHISLSWSEQGESEWWGIEVDPKTVGQYTGLKDRNGVDIYEGDVVTCCHELFGEQKPLTGIIEFQKGVFIVKGGYAQDSLNRVYSIQVISNIHKNPEIPKP